MSFFDDLFPNFDGDHQQNRKIRDLHTEVANASFDSEIHGRAIRLLTRRVDQLELMNRALLELLLHAGVVDRDGLSVMMQQVDLLDGVEDGVVSPQVHAAAPTCGACGRYVNPERATCVYCQTPMTTKAEKKAPVRTVVCSSCSATVPERSSYYSESGVVCGACFA
jgi:hypothetical protein